LTMHRKLKILFLCTGNSCRSQMAEGWCRHLKGESIDAYSAGIETHGLNPLAVKVMKEAGIDISRHRSKNVKELEGIKFDYVITVCGHANENCPLFPVKTKVVHVGFDDPPKLAKSAKTEKEVLNCYRRVRDEIRDFIAKIPARLSLPEDGGLFSPPLTNPRGLENPRSFMKTKPSTEGGFSNPPTDILVSPKFYNPFSPVERTKHHLPHRQQSFIYYFVSWRMADSLPREKIIQLDKERDFWLSAHPKPWDEETEEEFHARFSHVIDELLDAGSGSCLLKDPRLSRIVSDSLLHFNHIRHEIESFIIMPNHVHVLFSIIEPYKLEQIVKSWKGFSARKINAALDRKGDFWQEDYWDRMIRSENHLRKCKEYIIENPQKAHLEDGAYYLYNKE